VRLYLSSAGVGDRPERLVELLRGGRRAVVIANALDRSPEFRGVALAEELVGLGRLGLDARELDLRRERADALAEVDLVWVCGGNVFELRRAGRRAAVRRPRADRLCDRPALLRAGAARDPRVRPPRRALPRGRRPAPRAPRRPGAGDRRRPARAGV